MPYPPYQPASRRFLSWGLVLLLHAGLIYGLANGLAQRMVDVVQPAIQARIITEATPQKSTPSPPPPPVMTPPLAVVPPPEVHIATPPPRPVPVPRAITRPAPRPPAPPRVEQPKVEPRRAEPVRILPRINTNNSRQPEYPLAARQQGQEGTVVLQVLVGPDGRVIDAKLVQSCGFELLDKAALAGVKEDYRFTPGTVDGKPQPMWRTVRFVWKLN